MKCRPTIAVSLCVIACLAAGSVFSGPSPRLIDYQGRLTDPAGNPLKGTFTVLFTIYDAPTGGTVKWEEKGDVTTGSDGLFTTELGSANPIAPDIFDGTARYLGIRVDSDPELQPRNQLTTAPMAFYSTIAQSAQTAASAPGYLPLAGGAMSGPTFHNGVASRWQSDGSDRIVADPVNRKVLIVGTNGVERVRLSDESGGILALWDTSLSTYGGALLGAVGFGGGKGGTLIMDDSAGAVKVWMDAGAGGDGSVVLPDGAIDSREILDEPGIASSVGAGVTVLSCISEPVLATVTISIPTAGYIVLDAFCLAECSSSLGTPAGAGGAIGISDTAGVPPSYDSEGYFYYTLPAYAVFDFTATTKRIYYKGGAGTYQFYLNGTKYGMCTSTQASVKNCILQATYYPSSYGSVAALVTQADAVQFQKAEAVSVPNGPDPKAAARTMYQVDLRELELKAAKAQAEAERLQRQLVEEKLRQVRAKNSIENR